MIDQVLRCCKRASAVVSVAIDSSRGPSKRTCIFDNACHIRLQRSLGHAHRRTGSCRPLVLDHKLDLAQPPGGTPTAGRQEQIRCYLACPFASTVQAVSRNLRWARTVACSLESCPKPRLDQFHIDASGRRTRKLQNGICPLHCVEQGWRISQK